MNKTKIAATAVCGVIGAGLGYVGYKLYVNKTNGDSAETNTGTLEAEADNLDHAPEDAFVPKAAAADSDTTRV